MQGTQNSILDDLVTLWVLKIGLLMLFLPYVECYEKTMNSPVLRGTRYQARVEVCSQYKVSLKRSER